MAKVNGKDVVLTIEDDEYTVVCARSIQFDINREMIETSVTGSGFTRTFVPGAIEWSGSIEGLTFISDLTNNGDTYSLYQILLAGSKVKLVWYEEDTDNAFYLKKEGYGYINSVSEISSFDNVVTFNANFTGSGPITITSGNV